MTRRGLLKTFTALSLLPFGPARAETDEKLGALQKPASAWRDLVTPEQYDVLFHEATERAFSHPYQQEKRAGTYLCTACYLPLFDSSAKYDSGTGWPSFYRALPEAVATKPDRTLWYVRNEYHCARCGGHQGHVFDDGPQPTGLRYCNNGLALKFVPKGDPLPALRG